MLVLPHSDCSGNTEHTVTVTWVANVKEHFVFSCAVKSSWCCVGGRICLRYLVIGTALPLHHGFLLHPWDCFIITWNHPFSRRLSVSLLLCVTMGFRTMVAYASAPGLGEGRCGPTPSFHSRWVFSAFGQAWAFAVAKSDHWTEISVKPGVSLSFSHWGGWASQGKMFSEEHSAANTAGPFHILLKCEFEWHRDNWRSSLILNQVPPLILEVSVPWKWILQINVLSLSIHLYLNSKENSYFKAESYYLWFEIPSGMGEEAYGRSGSCEKALGRLLPLALGESGCTPNPELPPSLACTHSSTEPPAACQGAAPFRAFPWPGAPPRTTRAGGTGRPGKRGGGRVAGLPRAPQVRPWSSWPRYPAASRNPGSVM